MEQSLTIAQIEPRLSFSFSKKEDLKSESAIFLKIRNISNGISNLEIENLVKNFFPKHSFHNDNSQFDHRLSVQVLREGKKFCCAIYYRNGTKSFSTRKKSYEAPTAVLEALKKLDRFLVKKEINFESNYHSMAG